MNLETAQFLLSPQSQEALAELAANPAGLDKANQLATISRLRRSFETHQVAGLVEVATARLKATQQGKFSHASEMFFTKTGLEQSSGELISRHRAARFADVLSSGSHVADLGCGIGGDSLGLAQHFQVTGVDFDPARLLFAASNAAVYGVPTRFQPLEADITTFDPAPFDGLFFDPARRTEEGRRLFSVEDYAPPLSIIKGWLARVPELGVKIAPGVDYAELAGYECEVEIISENGDVKEAVLWFGKLRSQENGQPVKRRATLLPAVRTLTNQPNLPHVTSAEPLAYLYEPDGAVIRAGLVEELALVLGARKIDPSIAFLTTPELIATPFARAYRIIESSPFSLKKLNRRLNELGAGRVVVKKRGSPIEPPELERALKLNRSNTLELTVVLTHVLGQHYAIICETPIPSIEF